MVHMWLYDQATTGSSAFHTPKEQCLSQCLSHAWGHCHKTACLFKAACCCAGGLAGTISWAHRCFWKDSAEAQAASDKLHDISARNTIPSVVVHQHSLPCCRLSIQRVHHGDCCGSAAIEFYTCAGWPDSGSAAQLQGSLQLLERVKTWCLCNTGSQSCAVPAFLHQRTQKTNFL